MQEGAHINRSLLALGNCINALSERGGGRTQYVNFRDSKLTRLLKVQAAGRVCACVGTCVYVCTHMLMCAWVHVCPCVHVFVCARTCVHMDVYVHVFVHLCAHVCVGVHVCPAATADCISQNLPRREALSEV